jgi:hypothetical protein
MVPLAAVASKTARMEVERRLFIVMVLRDESVAATSTVYFYLGEGGKHGLRVSTNHFVRDGS